MGSHVVPFVFPQLRNTFRHFGRRDVLNIFQVARFVLFERNDNIGVGRYVAVQLARPTRDVKLRDAVVTAVLHEPDERRVCFAEMRTHPLRSFFDGQPRFAQVVQHFKHLRHRNRIRAPWLERNPKRSGSTIVQIFGQAGGVVNTYATVLILRVNDH